MMVRSEPWPPKGWNVDNQANVIEIELASEAQIRIDALVNESLGRGRVLRRS